MNMSNFDYYSSAQRIAQALSDEGLSDRATKITDAIATGSTGTEILMALHWQLTELLRQGHRPSAETSSDREELLREIDKRLT